MTTPELASRLRASTVEVRQGGSGVIWSVDGAIVTNAHVLRSREPVVVLRDGREFPAAVVHYDRRRDLALLRIAATDLPAVTIGDSGHLRAGQVVTAVGNPFGIPGAVTSGVIHSAGGRWIETSVRLAPGNSGGLLADAEGCVIGINTMIQAGLAFAIPSNAIVAFVRAARARAETKAA